MDLTIIGYGYAVIWLLCGLAITDRKAMAELIASLFAALFWPVLLPLGLVRAIVRHLNR